MPNEFSDLIAKLDALKGDALKKAERKALTEVGQIVKTAIVERTPVQSGVAEGLLKPGELAANIKAAVHIASDKSTTTGDVSSVTIGPGTAVTRSVANWVENGHANARATKGKKTTDPHPFIRPAQDATQQQAIDAYAATMTAEVTKALN
ncbi:HK97-gp10 family putative phage morphogenesis protein [Granulicella mallensis]|uniref:Phage protein, HK97 gp10 family n=1 Tax=Granulicella mallensis (strain ATCC BAA-1857 / DSM 23137 / MP5ACTX8) TaxID=682795 RepID=G8NRA2_GRAMM|nr:HK97-gp10 family putative phage morphogenesis protein [Granulicella mallensis]AEU36180.1 phage protein, HK97 gp10 family [Granulicella mallensis MP5ACTX8]